MLIKNFSNQKLEAGIDEAGRGSLVGPVTAAAVILDNDLKIPCLNDSKNHINMISEIIKKHSQGWRV